MKKNRNEICNWIQMLAFIVSTIDVYKDKVLWGIYTLLLMLVIEFVCKDKET